MNNMIEVFKTNVVKPSQAKTILKILQENFIDFKVNFDLADCDKVLRVQGKSFSPEEIIKLVTAHGYRCEVLD